MFRDDSDREQFFETAIAQAQREVKEDGSNAEALIRWGGALLELAHHRQGDEAVECIHGAIEKLNEALAVDPARTEAHWCIGNAHTSLGFLQSTKAEALLSFERAKAVFQKCRDKEPDNETYRKALEMCAKAPDYYDEIQAQIAQAQAAASLGRGGGRGGGGGGGGGGGRGGSGSGSGGGKDPFGLSDAWWDAAGWVALAAAVGAIALLARGGAGGAPAGAA